MSVFTLILLPMPTWNSLPLLRFYDALLHTAPRPLGFTLAGIALGLLALRLVDGRPTPLLFRLAVVATAALALGWLPGLVPAFWPLATATGAVLLLLLDETVHLLAGTLQAVGYAATQLHGDARRLFSPARKAPKPDAVSQNG